MNESERKRKKMKLATNIFLKANAFLTEKISFLDRNSNE